VVGNRVHARRILEGLGPPPRPLRNWLRSPSKSAEWMWDTARFSLGVTNTLKISPDVSIAMHPHAYKVACKAQIAEPEESAEFQNFLSNSGPPTHIQIDVEGHEAAALRGGRNAYSPRANSFPGPAQSNGGG
jgi:hypothetical protein